MALALPALAAEPSAALKTAIEVIELQRKAVGPGAIYDEYFDSWIEAERQLDQGKIGLETYLETRAFQKRTLELRLETKRIEAQKYMNLPPGALPLPPQ